jgi:hypothetical protein
MLEEVCRFHPTNVLVLHTHDVPIIVRNSISSPASHAQPLPPLLSFSFTLLFISLLRQHLSIPLIPFHLPSTLISGISTDSLWGDLGRVARRQTQGRDGRRRSYFDLYCFLPAVAGGSSLSLLWRVPADVILDSLAHVRLRQAIDLRGRRSAAGTGSLCHRRKCLSPRR